jgi:hypothetical protein
MDMCQAHHLEFGMTMGESLSDGSVFLSGLMSVTVGQILFIRRLRVLGALKTGRKSLFLRGSDLSYHSRQPVCLLDFYVHEPCQRSGIGKGLFEVM